MEKEDIGKRKGKQKCLKEMERNIRERGKHIYRFIKNKLGAKEIARWREVDEFNEEKMLKTIKNIKNVVSTQL